MASGDLPTYASEEAALRAAVGECCKGASPYCAADCLVEIAVKKRASIVAACESNAKPATNGTLRLFAAVKNLVEESNLRLYTADPSICDAINAVRDAWHSMPSTKAD